jgi:hypothetical protein
VKWNHRRRAITVRLQLSRTGAIQLYRHCKTAAHTSWNYRALLQHITAPWWPLKSCRHRTDIARWLHQASIIHLYLHEVISTPTILCCSRFPKKYLTPLKTILRSPQQQQLSQLSHGACSYVTAWETIYSPRPRKRGILLCTSRSVGRLVGRPDEVRSISWEPMISNMCMGSWWVEGDPYWFWGQ